MRLFSDHNHNVLRQLGTAEGHTAAQQTITQPAERKIHCLGAGLWVKS